MRVAAMFVSTCYLSHPVHIYVSAQETLLLLTLPRHIHGQPDRRPAGRPSSQLAKLRTELNLTKNIVQVHHCTIEIRTITTTTTAWKKRSPHYLLSMRSYQTLTELFKFVVYSIRHVRPKSTSSQRLN
jgi:hypothetical protein